MAERSPVEPDYLRHLAVIVEDGGGCSRRAVVAALEEAAVEIDRLQREIAELRARG